MITLNEAKKYCDINCSDYDETLTSMVEYAIAIIHNYVGKDLSQLTLTDIYQGTGRQFLPLSRINVTNVAVVKLNDEILDPSEYKIVKNMLFKSTLWDRKFIQGADTYILDYNIEIEYTFGYSYPTISNSVNNGTAPKELRYVANELVKRIFIEAGTNQQKSSESGSEQNASFSNSFYEITIDELLSKDIMRILDKYRKK